MNPQYLLGLTGPSGVGKTTQARRLQKVGAQIFPFGTALRAHVYAKYALDKEKAGLKEYELTHKPCSPWCESTVQDLLLEESKALLASDPLLWVRETAHLLLRKWDNESPIVIPDVRQPNEMLFVLSLGGVMVRLHRKGNTRPPQPLDNLLFAGNWAIHDVDLVGSEAIDPYYLPLHRPYNLKNCLLRFVGDRKSILDQETLDYIWDWDND